MLFNAQVMEKEVNLFMVAILKVRASIFFPYSQLSCEISLDSQDT